MDISPSSRPYFANPPSPTSSEKISLAASNTVYTYHCLCSHLLLATTTALPALPTRQNCPDNAHIMPLPPPPPPAAAAAVASEARPRRGSHLTPMDHYGLLLSTTIDRKPEILTSDMGFEKRWLQRCGRCGLVVGYQLDWAQFGSSSTSTTAASAASASTSGGGGAGSAGEEKQRAERSGRREDLVFLLPGGFVKTSDMVAGKTPSGSSADAIDALGVKTAEVRV